jgi:transposase
LENGRKSTTSHTPSSQIIGRSNSKGLREKSDKPSGGQIGHEGNTLLCKAIPDVTIPHIPSYCNECGLSLSDIASLAVERRQEIVIPPISAKYLEHVSHTKICRCGNKCVGSFPEGINAPIQYSGQIAALVAYLSAFQYLPYKRITLLLQDVFRMPMSEGTVDNLLERVAQKAMPAYQMIQQRIQSAAVVGGDETGASIGGKKGWMHTWQSAKLTFIVASMNRGFQTVMQYFPNGFPLSVYVSDCWAAQLKVPAKLHQLCIAHLLRELNNFIEALGCKWSMEMKALLTDALLVKQQLTITDYKQPCEQIIVIQKRLDKLLKEHENASPNKKVQAFIKRLEKYQKSILTFLYHYHVPPDNNASERAIRNVKVKTKVSGQYRSQRGAERFAILRSVIDTIRKSNNNIFEGLLSI